MWEAKLNIAIIVSPLKNIVPNFTICGIRQFFLKSAWKFNSFRILLQNMLLKLFLSCGKIIATC